MRNVAKLVKWYWTGSFYSGEDGKQNGYCSVGVSKIFVTRVKFYFETELFDRVCIVMNNIPIHLILFAADTALFNKLLYWYCDGAVLVLVLCCNGTVLCWFCTGTSDGTGTVMVPLLCCTGTVLVLHWYYTGTGTVLVLCWYWYCALTGTVLCWCCAGAVLYCTVLHCAVLYCTVLYCTVLYCTVLYYTLLYFTLLYSTVLYSTYSILLYSTAFYSMLLYSTLQRQLFCSSTLGENAHQF